MEKKEEILDDIEILDEDGEMPNVKKNKPNVLLYTLVMTVVFLIITLGVIFGNLSSIISIGILNYPKGRFVVSEAVLAVLVLIVMLIFKNSYVFTQKKEKLSKSLLYGSFYIVGFIVYSLMFGVIGGGFFKGHSTFNLFVGCFLVGVCEEFLCRGWLLNEFLERYGDSKKGVWFSIVVSGLIFGLLHFNNIRGGQDIAGTITQVISATASGIMFGTIYYKTKNIWSVIILHGMWDFGIMLGDLNTVTSLTVSVSQVSIMSFVFSILVALAELLNVIPYTKDINVELKKGKIIGTAIGSFVLMFIFLLLSGSFSLSMGEEFKFGNIKVNEYSLTRDNLTKYNIRYTTYSDYGDGVSSLIGSISEEIFDFTLGKNDDGKLVFKNNNTKKEIIFDCEVLRDYIIMEDSTYYVLGYIDYRDSSNTFLNYIYINKADLSNEDSFMDNIASSMQKYLISDIYKLGIFNDYDNNTLYLDAYDDDYGHYLLLEEGKMSILRN